MKYLFQNQQQQPKVQDSVNMMQLINLYKSQKHQPLQQVDYHIVLKLSG